MSRFPSQTTASSALASCCSSSDTAGQRERSSKSDLKRVSVPWDFRIMSLAQLVSSSGENVAGLIHGFESRWGHHRNYTQLHRNGIRPLPSTLEYTAAVSKCSSHHFIDARELAANDDAVPSEGTETVEPVPPPRYSQPSGLTRDFSQWAVTQHSSASATARRPIAPLPSRCLSADGVF